MPVNSKEAIQSTEALLPQQLHLIGIGGDGMSGLAGILLAMGYSVSGSEQTDPVRVKQKQLLAEFSAQGAEINYGHRVENLDPGTGLVVVSSAIEESNPEIQQARALRIPVIKRAEALGRLMRGKEGIAVAGCAGKTTTTAMLGLILEKAGLDPTVVMGSRLDAFGGNNFRYGGGRHFVAEADEFDHSFLQLYYRIAVLTNIFWGDHLDYFKDEQAMLAAFAEFISRIPPEGGLVAFRDDSNVSSLFKNTSCRVITFGFEPEADYVIGNVYQVTEETTFDLFNENGLVCEVTMPVVGRHNVIDATAAIIAAHEERVDFSVAAHVLEGFRGVKRRLEVKGTAGGVTIVDDFGHHPVQIGATLEGLKQKFPDRRIVAVFQPRQFRRTAVLLDELAACFEGVDEIVVTDISRGLGDTSETMASVHAQDLVKKIQTHGQRAEYIGELAEIAPQLSSRLRKGDVLITLGTGNIYEAGEEILRRLSSST